MPSFTIGECGFGGGSDDEQFRVAAATAANAVRRMDVQGLKLRSKVLVLFRRQVLVANGEDFVLQQRLSYLLHQQVGGERRSAPNTSAPV